MKIVIEVNMGNQAMQTYADVRRAIQCSLAVSTYGNEEPKEGDGRRIFDLNGQSVGKWSVEE